MSEETTEYQTETEEHTTKVEPGTILRTHSHGKQEFPVLICPSCSQRLELHAQESDNSHSHVQNDAFR